jgi:hypothetical protein
MSPCRGRTKPVGVLTVPRLVWKLYALYGVSFLRSRHGSPATAEEHLFRPVSAGPRADPMRVCGGDPRNRHPTSSAAESFSRPGRADRSRSPGVPNRAQLPNVAACAPGRRPLSRQGSAGTPAIVMPRSFAPTRSNAGPPRGSFSAEPASRPDQARERDDPRFRPTLRNERGRGRAALVASPISDASDDQRRFVSRGPARTVGGLRPSAYAAYVPLPHTEPSRCVEGGSGGRGS